LPPERERAAVKEFAAIDAEAKAICPEDTDASQGTRVVVIRDFRFRQALPTDLRDLLGDRVVRESGVAAQVERRLP